MTEMFSSRCAISGASNVNCEKDFVAFASTVGDMIIGCISAAVQFVDLGNFHVTNCQDEHEGDPKQLNADA